MNIYTDGFLGSAALIRTAQWGRVKVEAASFSPVIDGDFVVYFGDPTTVERPLVRIHSACVFSESLGSTECDCAEQLRMALNILKQERTGILIYTRLEGRGAGLAAKIKATALEVAGMDTYDSRVAIGVSPDSRDYAGVARFLAEKGILRVRLLTNNPRKAGDLLRTGLDVVTTPLFVERPNPEVAALYAAKRQRFGHSIPETQVKPEQLELGL